MRTSLDSLSSLSSATTTTTTTPTTISLSPLDGAMQHQYQHHHLQNSTLKKHQHNHKHQSHNRTEKLRTTTKTKEIFKTMSAIKNASATEQQQQPKHTIAATTTTTFINLRRHDCTSNNNYSDSNNIKSSFATKRSYPWSSSCTAGQIVQWIFLILLINLSTDRTCNHLTMPKMDNEKYSLRQRQKRKHILTSCSIDSQGYASDNSTESIVNLREIPASRSAKCPNSKSKSKAAPLSKYRRKTANARERTRMREINSAFETLRTCVPVCITNEDSNSTNEKLTKITTLRLAMKYIGILSDALTNPNEADYDFLYECTQPKVIERTAMENFEPEIEEIPEKPQKLTKSSKNSKSAAASTTAKTPTAARKTATLKRQTKKQKLDNLPVAPNTSPIPPSYQESPASNASSAYASLSSSSEASASPNSNSSYIFENNNNVCNSFTYSHPHHCNSMSDLSNLMLESDGESLNISEHCLSPLRTKQKTNSSSDDPYECSPTNMQTLENPLELSLRLMEPATNSLSLSVDPIISHSSCISPLMNLEPFGSFDLFHSEFNEQAALDLFLT